MQGASAIQTALKEHPGAPLRVFVIWEPVLPTDFAAPTSGVLARIADPRTAQFWDKQLVVSGRIREAKHAEEKIIWDVVAVFPRGVRWENAFPSPSFGGNPVVEVIGDFRRALSEALATSN